MGHLRLWKNGYPSIQTQAESWSTQQMAEETNTTMNQLELSSTQTRKMRDQLNNEYDDEYARNNILNVTL
jgi:hypothetical protein